MGKQDVLGIFQVLDGKFLGEGGEDMTAEFSSEI